MTAGAITLNTQCSLKLMALGLANPLPSPSVVFGAPKFVPCALHAPLFELFCFAVAKVRCLWKGRTRRALPVYFKVPSVPIIEFAVVWLSFPLFTVWPTTRQLASQYALTRLVYRYIAELRSRFLDFVKVEFFLSSQYSALDVLVVVYFDGFNRGD